MGRRRSMPMLLMVLLMLATPFTPMAGAVEGRSEILTADMFWSDTIEELVITDIDSDGYDWSGTFVRATNDWKIHPTSNFATLDGADHRTYIDAVNGHTILTTATGTWSIIDTQVDNSNTFSTECDLNTTGGVVSPGPGSHFGDTCALQIQEVNGTFIEAVLEVQNTSSSDEYDIYWHASDCGATNGAHGVEQLTWFGDGNTYTRHLSFPNLQSGDYHIDFDLLKTSQIVGSVDSGCTGSPPPPTPYCHHVGGSSANPSNSTEWMFCAASSGNLQALDTAVDVNGNSYHIGKFSGTAVFGDTSLTSSGSNDIFVTKLSSTGQWLWAVRAGSAGVDDGNSIALDSNGNPYVIGSFQSTADFGNISLTSIGNTDIFVAKLSSSSGLWQWAVRAGSTTDDSGYGIALDSYDDIYLTGYFKGTADFGDDTVTSSGISDIFVAKINNAGTWNYAISTGSSQYEMAYDIAVDSSNNVYITGYFQGTVSFGTHSVANSGGGGNDLFVAKMGAQGQWEWAASGGSTDSSGEPGKGIAVDSSGNVYVTGIFRGTATYGSTSITSGGGKDIVVAKLSSAGSWVWAEGAGSSGHDEGHNIAVDPSGNAYVTGIFVGTVTFGDGTIATNGGQDAFAGQIDASGSWAWVNSGGGSGTDKGSAFVVYDGLAYSSGYFAGPASGSSSFNQFEFISDGGEDTGSGVASYFSMIPIAGGTEPPATPQIVTNYVEAPDTITGLIEVTTSMKNIMAGDSYDIIRTLYATDSGSSCDYSNQYFSNSDQFNAPSDAEIEEHFEFNFILGANITNAEPFELHSDQDYCFRFTVLTDEGEPTHHDVIFTPPAGFSGCAADEYCWDPNFHGYGASFSPDGKWVTFSSPGGGDTIANIPIPAGQWYWEYEIVRNSGTNNFAFVGVHTGAPDALNTGHSNGIGSSLDGWGVNPASMVYHNNEWVQIGCDTGGCWTADPSYVIGIAIDTVYGDMWYSMNGAWLDGPPHTGTLTPSTGALPAFGADALWDENHGDAELYLDPVYPAVTENGASSSLSFKLVTSSTTYGAPAGFDLLVDEFEPHCYNHETNSAYNSYNLNECTGFYWDISGPDGEGCYNDQAASVVFEEYNEDECIAFEWLETAPDDCDPTTPGYQQMDCANVCGGNAEEDDCGTCDADPSNDCDAGGGDDIWEILTLAEDDVGAGIGLYNSIALDSDGYPHISYYDAPNSALMYAAYDDWDEDWIFHTVDDTGATGMHTSIVVDSNDVPHISYIDVTNGAVMYATLSENGWMIQTLDDTACPTPCTETSITAHGDEIHIAYHDTGQGSLKYAIWDVLEETWDMETIDDGGGTSGNTVGSFSSLTIDDEGISFIIYYDSTSERAKFAYGTIGDFNIEYISDTGDKQGKHNSIAIDGDGVPNVVYYDENHEVLKFGKFGYGFDNLWAIYTVPLPYEGAKIGPADTSIAINDDGDPVITFNVANGPNPVGLHMGFSMNAVGSNWSHIPVEVGNSGIGLYSSIAIYDDDILHISYHDSSDGRLQYACGDGSGGGCPDFSNWYNGQDNGGVIEPFEIDLYWDYDWDGDGNADDEVVLAMQYSWDNYAPESPFDGEYLVWRHLSLNGEGISWTTNDESQRDFTEILGYTDPIEQQYIPTGDAEYCLTIEVSTLDGMLIAEGTHCEWLTNGDSGGGFDPNSGLVGYWNMDEPVGSSRFTDSTGNDNEGIIADGATLGTNALFGNGLEMHGPPNSAIIDYLEIEDDSFFTLSMWVNIPSASNDAYIFTIGDTVFSPGALSLRMAGPTSPSTEGSLSLEQSGQVLLNTYVSPDESFELDYNTWHHLVLVVTDSGTDVHLAHLYVDGVHRAAGSIPVTIDGGVKIHLGSAELGNSAIHGLIDEVRLYNFAMAISEVDALLNNASEFAGVGGGNPGGNQTGGNQTGGNQTGGMGVDWTTDVSSGASAFATSEFDSFSAAVNSVDDDNGTSWISAGACPQTLTIDFGTQYEVGALRLLWDSSTDNPTEYEINTWTPIDSWQRAETYTSSGGGRLGIVEHLVTPTTAQKIQINCLQSAGKIQLNEVEVFVASPEWDTFDYDGDGINNGGDKCWNGFSGWVSDTASDYDTDGCRDTDEDSDDDNDAILDSEDFCALGASNWDSWNDSGIDYDHDGCRDSDEDPDDDADAVLDASDACAQTRLGATVDVNGCETGFPDADGDGVADSYDNCPGTPSNVSVDDWNGCPLDQDTDGDGVPDTIDDCVSTPPDTPVTDEGCIDLDQDGVWDASDFCPGTPAGSAVDDTGCELMPDADGDGVPDEIDECPETKELEPEEEVDEVGCLITIVPEALQGALDFMLNIDENLGLPDGTLEIIIGVISVLFAAVRFAGRRTLGSKQKRVDKYTRDIRLARSIRELDGLEKRISKDNEKNLLPRGGYGDLMELVEMRATELGEMDRASEAAEAVAASSVMAGGFSEEDVHDMRESRDMMREEMEHTREAVDALQDELSSMRGPPRGGKGKGKGKGKGRRGPPQRRGADDDGFKMQAHGGPRRPSLHPADLDGDGVVTPEEREEYRRRQEEEDRLWEFD